MKFYITRCENADFRTRSVRKTAFYTRGDEKGIIVLVYQEVSFFDGPFN